MSPHIYNPHVISRVQARVEGDRAWYRDGRIHADNIALFNQQFACLVAKLADLVLWNGTTCAELLNCSTH